MRFDREPWVKLYKRESPHHRLMSLEARCFRDFLLRHANDDGVLLPRTKNVARDLCKVVAADSKDARKVRQWVKELTDVGYLSVSETGEVIIKKFVEGQAARTKNAERQARWKAKQKSKKNVPEDVTSNGDVTLPVTERGDARETLHARSGDEMRREEIPPVGPPSGTTAEVPDEDQPTPCPTEVLPDDVVQQLAAHMGVSMGVIRDAEREFKTYWTIGMGAGKRFRRGMWVRKCRERIRHRYEAGELNELKQAAGAEVWSDD